MRTLTIEVPEGVARDLVAPYVFDAPIEPRRKDALEEITELVKNALARPPKAPVQVFRLSAIASDLEGHVGHRVTVATSSGVVTRVHCEDCGVEVDPS